MIMMKTQMQLTTAMTMTAPIAIWKATMILMMMGMSFLNSVMTMPKKDASSQINQNTRHNGHSCKISKSQNMNVPCQNMDDLLAQMDVATNSMDEENTAKPFKEILQVETGSDFEGSPDYSLN
jgi:hypothetical protein